MGDTGQTDELVGPARKVFIKQLQDLEGRRWRTELDALTGKQCITPMIGGACAAGAEAVRVWLQGKVSEITEEVAVLFDGTGRIQFLSNEIEPEQLPKPGAYCQVVGKIALSKGPQSPVFILTELCAEVPATPAAPNPDQAWTLEVLDYQSKHIFIS